jgi:hypothetical protein
MVDIVHEVDNSKKDSCSLFVDQTSDMQPISSHFTDWHIWALDRYIAVIL